ncbi:EcoAI/FtnUII family type I restriction enzme subunit R [Runella salmonicolor]|uniref:DEAD/DEAH box helicase family protein n=1 Tax=Runella salmonicolor TaxID=2950278 RepID=A0ABT1FVM0_9BACT|nr:type I restriction endonuclease subunit R [Runella salmonicolor]MCP1385806.1 DEAD/DEAH box helicase family protein [Runella salmonicolor]
MNEAETRAELIDPKLRACGWGVVEGSKVLRERQAQITNGKINVGGVRSKPMKADYILVYKGIKLAVVEAKSDELSVGEGVAQAKQYAEKLKLETTYATNGKEIYQICLKTGAEGLVAHYLTPDELWNKTFPPAEFGRDIINEWREKFSSIPFEDINKTKPPRFYQEIAINHVLEAVATGKNRILLTLATGTGKTTIAFQIAWKLFQARWNLRWDGVRRPRILFLADRNGLANQAFGEFTTYSAFSEDALVRISPGEIKKKGSVPTNGSVFFTIFQTFMSGTDKEGNPSAYFGAYPADYFDFIIIDECHRGGANDEGSWRAILEYFSPAVQLGLTATPKRKLNVDTYKYFGEPMYTYSLKEGINDGFLTPFKVKRIKTTLDDYIYTPDDQIIEGQVEEGKLYQEPDFNKIIEIKEREAKRVQIYMDEANQDEKAIIFCATQDHAAAVRDLVNQYKKSKNPNYCVRVTANDGEIGEQFLREFQDNEKTIPTILTTSQKLSTGVDARNIRNIVLLRPVNSMIEFKQIVGRGTRLFDGKEFFTIYDFVDAYHHFADPEWDGEPLEPEPPGVVSDPKEPYTPKKKEESNEGGKEDGEVRKRIKIKLRDGKERDIQHMISTSFWSADGRPISAEEFMGNLFGKLPELFQSEEELRIIWSNPLTRRTLLEKLAEAGFGKAELSILQKLIDAEKSDLFDVLEYVFNSDIKPMTREARVAAAQASIFALLNDKQKEFIAFVLSKYIESGVEELDQEKLPLLLTNKYQSLEDAKRILGEVSNIRQLFMEFQKHLYEQKAA